MQTEEKNVRDKLARVAMLLIVFAVIIDPIERAMTHFVGGYAKFIDYWVIIQGTYLYAHLLADALVNQ